MSAMASAASSAQLVLLLFVLVSTCFLPTLSQQTSNSSVAVQSPPPQFSFSFNFTNPSSYDQSTDILLEGDAKVNGKLIDLTCDSFEQSSDSCKGRMSYRHPVPLCDDTTLASFSTSFTFEIIANNSLLSTQGDGMAFFLTGFPSSMPPRSEGEYLGLMSNDSNPYGPEQFVAVEFDTYQNDDTPHDPSDNHIGIDINSVNSKNTTISFLPMRGKMTATIKFDNMTQILVASLEINGSHEPVVVTSHLPDLRKLFIAREVAVGFSASTGVGGAERHQVLAWSFNSTLAPAIPPQGHNNKTTMIMIITIIGGLVLLVVVVWLILSCLKWTNRQNIIEKQGKQGPTRFEYQDLAAATDNFSEEKKLGQGFFGVVYKGYLKKLECNVAVKKILNTSTGPNANSDFYAELNAITSVKHKNLVKLVGWCRGSSCNFVEFMCWCCKNHSNNKLFLVYELVPKGNLHENLHKEETLPWETRYKIVKDIAYALLYLHHECDPFILHRDIKPSNILLDDNFNAKLADFGLSRIVDNSDSSRILTIPVGTEAYLDPQCKKTVGMVEFSRSSDVYSFGIVLLEIACGKQGSMLLREQVWQLYTKRCLLQAADAKLKGEFNTSEMESMLILGLSCSFFDSKMRPTMEQVMAALEHGKPLPHDLNSLDTTSVSATELEMYIDPQAPTSANSSSYEQMQE